MQSVIKNFYRSGLKIFETWTVYIILSVISMSVVSATNTINLLMDTSRRNQQQKPFIQQLSDDGFIQNVSGALRTDGAHSFQSALDFLVDNRELFGVSDPERELRLKAIRTDYKGLTHITLQQFYRDIPVYKSYIRLHSDTGGNLSSVSSGYFRDLHLNTIPVLSPQQAVHRYTTGKQAETPAELVIFIQAEQPRLAYAFDILVPGDSHRYIVDSNSGELIKTYSLVYEDGPVIGSGVNLLDETIDTLNIYQGTSFDFSPAIQGFGLDSIPGTSQYNTVDASLDSSSIIYLLTAHNTNYDLIDYVFSDTPVFNSEISFDSHPSAVSAMDYLRKTHDYFLNFHDFDGQDGLGVRTLALVDMGPNWQNAMNDGIALVFGAGGGANRPWCAGQDVVTHEFTHGVTGSTSGLVYENQSGAMNESLSDIFGYLVEAQYQDGGDWLVSEDITLNGSGIRNMADPTEFNDPDNINSPFFVSPGGSDFGGVHTNSGIPNKAFQMMVEGGVHYGINVEPFDQDTQLSRQIASDIWFLWNTQYLDPYDNFLNGAFKMADICNDLYPQFPDYFDTVYKAWLSVGVDIYAVDLDITAGLTMITEGDGDSVVNPGEDFDYFPQLTNIGSNEAFNVSGSISCSEQGIQIEPGEINFGEIMPGDSASVPGTGFSFAVSEDVELGDAGCFLYVDALNLSGQTNSFIFPLEINISLNQEFWPFLTDIQIVGSPAVTDLQPDSSDPEILFGDNSGMFYQLDPQGLMVENWPFETGDDIWGSPAVADIDNDGDKEVIIGSKNKHLYIFNPDGSIQQDINVNKFLMGTPAVGNLDGDSDLEIVIGTYSSPTGSNQILVINPDGSNVDGFPLTLGEKIQRGAALADFNGNDRLDIVVGTDSENIYLILDDGSVAPGFPFTNAGGDFRQAPSILKTDDGQMVIFAGSKDDHIYAVNSDGSLRFSIETGGDISTSCAFLDDPEQGTVILFGSNDGFLYAVTPEGEFIDNWPVDLGDAVRSTPALADLDNNGTAEIITGTSAGVIFILDIYGNPFPYFPFYTQVPITGSAAIADTDDDGDLEILVGTTINMMNIDIKAQGSVEGYWNMFRGNLNRTGYYDAGSDSVLPGDINHDQITDILDIIVVVNLIIEEVEPEPDQLVAADLNYDGIIDILDIILMIDIIIGS